MLAKSLHTHLDGIDAINAEATAEIDKILNLIDIKGLIADAHEELGQAIEQIDRLLEDKYQPLAHQDGVKLAKIIEARGVVVDPSKDPTKNQGDAAK